MLLANFSFYGKAKSMKIIADNFTVSNPIILEKLKQKDKKFFYEFFEQILQVAEIIDINLGQIRKDIEENIRFIFKVLYEVHKFKVVIDTINIDAIKISIKYCKEKPVLNAISLDPFKIEKILPIAAENNLDIIALVMDMNVPVSVDEKIILTMEILTQCQKIGLDASNIIVDPVVAPLGWERGSEINSNNLQYLKLVKEAISNEIRTCMGFSNLTTGATGISRKVRKLDSFYMSMAYMNDLDFALVNVFDKNIIDAINFYKILQGEAIFSPAIFNE